MSQSRQRRVGGSAAQPRRDRALGGAWPRRGRARTETRLALTVFALALILALGAVVMLIAAGTVQALPQAAALTAKSDGWVGLAATVSVLISAAAGVLLVQRYFNTRRRR